MTSAELTADQKELFNKFIARGFDQGIVSMVRCMRTVAAQSKQANKREPSLLELAAAIERGLQRKHAKKKENEQK